MKPKKKAASENNLTLDPRDLVDRARLVERVAASGVHTLKSGLAAEASALGTLELAIARESWLSEGAERAARRDALRSDIEKLLARVRTDDPEIASATAATLRERHAEAEAKRREAEERANRVVEVKALPSTGSRAHASTAQRAKQAVKVQATNDPLEAKRAEWRRHAKARRERNIAAGLNAHGKPRRKAHHGNKLTAEAKAEKWRAYKAQKRAEAKAKGLRCDGQPLKRNLKNRRPDLETPTPN